MKKIIILVVVVLVVAAGLVGSWFAIRPRTNHTVDPTVEPTVGAAIVEVVPETEN